MIQKTKVTSGTLLKPSSEFLFISCIRCAIYGYALQLSMFARSACRLDVDLSFAGKSSRAL
jgi:hypothetical protein